MRFLKACSPNLACLVEVLVCIRGTKYFGGSRYNYGNERRGVLLDR